jgi:NAD(P)-dependent dehydrogenase (short-subunit alcohol dehydrogenase family)
MEGQKGQVVYAATKGAVDSMVLPLTRDLAKYKIRVMGIAPGIFHTPMIGQIRKEVIDQISTQIPTGRFGNADEFAKLAQMIIESTYANGSVWRFDGGMRLPYL